MSPEADPKDAWVLLCAFDDPMLARMTLDFLEDHDIPVQTRGDSPAGVRNLYSPFDIRIVVPASRLQEARDALSAFTAEPQPETPFRGPLPPSELTAEDDAPAAALRKKRGAFALVLAFLVPIGGGHFYAQQSAAGAILAASLAVFVVGASLGYPAVGAAAVVLVVLDAVVSMIFAVRQCNERRVPPAGTQRLRALTMVSVALGSGVIWSQVLFPSHPDEALTEGCENHDAHACASAARWYQTNRPSERATIQRLRDRACSLGDTKACLSVP